ncbi:MAG: efflux RND transporter periplasmic adaptor subunit, partial [Rhodobacteraceae bacterium]|nr:efflux RND transporter periplasmic adaptor subunit [Paracoccaceae bacterium]
MRRTWILGAVALVGLAAAGWFLTERPLTVTAVSVEKNVPLRLYGLGSVEARVLSRVGFEVGAALVSVSAD